MIYCPSIRRLSPEERERRDLQEAERYETVRAEIEAELHHEYNEQFGPTFQKLHPFKLDGAAVHDQVLAHLRAESAMN
jgi:hypothetical protein